MRRSRFNALGCVPRAGAGCLAAAGAWRRADGAPAPSWRSLAGSGDVSPKRAEPRREAADGRLAAVDAALKIVDCRPDVV
jgi:hypothetical protein